jgi:hypothetical protein
MGRHWIFAKERKSPALILFFDELHMLSDTNSTQSIWMLTGSGVVFKPFEGLVNFNHQSLAPTLQVSPDYALVSSLTPHYKRPSIAL